MAHADTQISVLHVDDDAEFLASAAAALEGAGQGLEVLTATDLDDAWSTLAAERVDCVVCDYDLPETDGIAFLERVREEYPALPVVIFTGTESEAVASEAISAGLSDYRRKGTGDDQVAALAARIRSLVDRTRTQREELEQYRQIVESMAEQAAIYDRDGRILTVNRSLVEFLDRSRADLEGSRSRLLERLRETVPGDPLAALLAGDRAAIAGELEVGFVEPPAVLAYRLSPVRMDGEVRRVVAVTREVTERWEYERLLEAQHERLEEFAGVLSHDLRNSLNVAESRLELAADECDSAHLDAIGDAHERIEGELDSLLTLARGAGYALDFEAVEPEPVARRAWDQCRTRAATLQVAVAAAIQADPDALQQLLRHTFSNAVEHGGPDVTVTVGRHPGGFYVEDDGAGVPPADRDRLLEPGYTGARAGSGFGLRIVKEIGTAHGWVLRLATGTADGLRLEFDDVRFAD